MYTSKTTNIKKVVPVGSKKRNFFLFFFLHFCIFAFFDDIYGCYLQKLVEKTGVKTTIGSLHGGSSETTYP